MGVIDGVKSKKMWERTKPERSEETKPEIGGGLSTTLVAERKKDKSFFSHRFYFLCEEAGKIIICCELGGEGWMPEEQWL